MLTFNSHQMLAFEKTVWQRFVEELTATMAAEFPVVREALGPDGFLRAVHENANAAHETFGLQEDAHVAGYVRWCFQLGSGFDSDIAIFWAGDILRDRSFVLTNEKVSFLESEILAYLRAAFVPQDALVPVEVYGRYARFLTGSDLRRAQADNPVSTFESIWPEKAALCEYRQLHDFHADAAALGDGYGLVSQPVLRRYALMAFVLGARFDMDPVHAWAGEILRDEDTSSDQKIHLLEQGALTHVLEPWIAAQSQTQEDA